MLDADGRDLSPLPLQLPSQAVSQHPLTGRFFSSTASVMTRSS
jgi:hypothetical protein